VCVYVCTHISEKNIRGEEHFASLPYHPCVLQYMPVFEMSELKIHCYFR